jgi:hypothetical protein
MGTKFHHCSPPARANRDTLVETTEQLISRLTLERDAALSALEQHRLAGAPRALVAADRLLGAYGIPWWITLEATLRVVAASWALRTDAVVGSKAMEVAVSDVYTLLAKIDAVLQDQR